MTIQFEDMLMVLVGLFCLFVYICIGAFFGWLIGMDEVSLAYIGVLFLWPAIIGFAVYIAAVMAWWIIMLIVVGIAGIFR